MNYKEFKAQPKQEYTKNYMMYCLTNAVEYAMENTDIKQPSDTEMDLLTSILMRMYYKHEGTFDIASRADRLCMMLNTMTIDEILNSSIRVLLEATS